MSRALRIYGNVYSPPSRAVMWLLRQYDIVTNSERVDVWKGERGPYGRVQEVESDMFDTRHVAMETLRYFKRIQL